MRERDVPRRQCSHCQRQTANPAYCSNACQASARWEALRAMIQRNAVAPTVKQARRFILERDGRRCAICGGSEWRGQPTPIVLDHVDGDADNWRLDNLRLICPNCDAQLPTFKSRNRGNGRAARRARYLAGKSY